MERFASKYCLRKSRTSIYPLKYQYFLMAKPNKIRILFLIFLLISFIVGAYVHSTMDLKYMIRRAEGMVESQEDASSNEDGKEGSEEGCPDVLIQRGTALHLYHSKKPYSEGSNPMVFKNLEEYGAYIKKQSKSCPILFLQQENDVQNRDVYRIRPSPFNPFAGVPANSALLKPYDGSVINELDASRDNGYNQNMYPGFDPQGLHIGRITEVDVIHQSTENAEISDNPMDTNWGGVLYTQQQIDEGKYVENEVTRTHYPKAGPAPPALVPNARTVVPVR